MSKHPPIKQSKVVLVDDHPVVRQGLAQLIESEPDLAVCGEAGTPTEALRVVKEHEPDIVVVDLSLAEGSGLDLIKDLKVRYPALPAMALSMHDEAVYAERVLRAGGRGYVMKDEAGDTIRAAILRVLSGEIYLSPAVAARMLNRLADTPKAEGGSPADCLSDRELQVFEFIGTGLGTTEIAETLHLSPKTIETYRAKIKDKLRLQDAGELRRHAIQWVQSRNLA